MSNQRQQNGRTLQTVNTRELLNEILERPVSERARSIGEALDRRIPKIEEMLPDFMKGQGPRLAKRAQMTFASDERLEKCPPDEFIRCVLEAAEMGFAIDGRMCYVVRYKQNFQCQLDYKAMVAVAKRMKTIKDIFAEVVCQNDAFRAWREDGTEHLTHERPFGQPRGEVIGVYCIIILQDHWRYELMDREELDAVQNRAPSKKGPWATDTNEMRRKTVVRKALKMYADDPGVLRLLELTDEEVEAHEEQQQPAKLSTASQLADRLNQSRQQSPASQPQKPQNQPERDQTSQAQEDGPDLDGSQESEDGPGFEDSGDAAGDQSEQAVQGNIAF